jgi:hypothetical protein
MRLLKKFLKIIAVVCIGIATFIPTLPLFYKAFVPFPKLEEAIVYTGTMSVVGEERCIRNRCSEPTYYVTDSAGKHEVFYGLPGSKKYPYPYPSENRASGTFWFHPTFGIIQERSRSPFTLGKTLFISYDLSKKEFEEEFSYKKAWLKTIPFLIFIIFLLTKFKSIFLD